MYFLFRYYPTPYYPIFKRCYSFGSPNLLWRNVVITPNPNSHNPRPTSDPEQRRQRRPVGCRQPDSSDLSQALVLLDPQNQRPQPC